MKDQKVNRVRKIAFYLPQFHPTPENSKWWNPGFTEWHNVAKARPLFPGHEQPNLPGELGFYDLRLPETQIAQSNLALEYGIESFCYWHYWFGADRRVLKLPYENMLKNPEIKVGHCFCWANHDWTKTWVGSEKEILMEQKYISKEDFIKHFYEMLPAFKDERYTRINGSPLVGIYDANFSKCKEFINTWQELAEKELAHKLHFFTLNWPKEWKEEDFLNCGFSNYSGNNPPYDWKRIKLSIIQRIKRKLYRFLNISCTFFDYDDFIKVSCNTLEKIEWPNIVANWDRTPRVKHKGEVFLNFTPQKFKVLFQKAVKLIESRPEEERVIFIKSWNEWAEGNYLEPDIKHGKDLLEAVKN